MGSDDSTLRPREPATNRVDWAEAFAAHGRWLRTVVLARIGEPGAVDDVLQDIRLAAIAKGDRLRDPDKAAPWLYRIAVAAAHEYRRRCGRRRKLHRRFAEQIASPNGAPREPDGLDWLLANEREALVRRALRQLPQREAEILLLKYTEDWTYQQIAEQLGLSASAVEARLHRARQRLRRCLRDLAPSRIVTLSTA